MTETGEVPPATWGNPARGASDAGVLDTRYLALGAVAEGQLVDSRFFAEGQSSYASLLDTVSQFGTTMLLR